MRINSRQYAKVLLESILENPEKKGDVVKKFAVLLHKKGATSRLPEIVECFERLWNEHFNVSVVEIISARALSKEVSSLLEEKAVSMANAKKVEIVKRIDSKIIGGVIFKYKDRILDMSLYTKFEHLKNILKG